MVLTGLFDSHCHLDDAQFDADREEVLARCRAQGVAHCLTAGSDVASSLRCVALAARHAWIVAAAGVHPHEAAQAAPGYLAEVRALAADARVVAVGEIGLDYHYDFSPRDVQKARLEEQLALAGELGKPVILHVRDAQGDMLDVLRARGADHPGGVIHCFTGSLESAETYLKLGYHISFAGAITYKNGNRIRDVAARMPRDRVLIETDSPYLSPEPLRGRRNEPHHVRYTCLALAQAWGIAPEQAADITRRNAQALFGPPVTA